MKKTALTVQAPAKLNLFLHVTGRRENGYHELQSLFTLIDLNDTLQFVVREDGGIYRTNEIQDLSPEDDLVVCAAKLLQQYTGTSLGADIILEKRIPSGGGLGGGSSDAATTLVSLNQLWHTGLSQQQLIDLGVQLGADVPFFIFGQTAIATGIGEQLQIFPLKPIYYLVLRPQLAIPTPLIFKSPDLVRNSPVLDDEALHNGRRLMEQAQLFARNDLEPVALKLFPMLATLIEGMREAGFNFRMTGSGSCFFMPFLSQAEAEQAKIAVEQWVAKQQPTLGIEQLFVVRGL
ncbi:MAG: 4-(cytidine 5'-diphospho)-2-C-methyl-D-erythritol kinase [Pelistega sp.]|nr:4-(cytidine 5'-diphospho)-2-C-methyl-D-erythritol kinase [Pelistega sp.]